MSLNGKIILNCCPYGANFGSPSEIARQLHRVLHCLVVASEHRQSPDTTRPLACAVALHYTCASFN